MDPEDERVQTPADGATPTATRVDSADHDQDEPAGAVASGSAGVAVEDDLGAARSALSARLALWAFVAYLAVALYLIVFHFGEGLWFAGDDWGFLDGRNLWSFNDLMRPQNGHWVALPVAVYQINYRIFGLESYVPFLILTAAMHLTLCTLLRVVMRRAGAGPWVATITAGTFVLFGAGYENILYALQITLLGSMVFGLTQLLLTDHDGPFDRRDAVAIGAGFLGLLCSSIGVALVVVVGAAVLLRRGWRMALVQTAPLGAVFVAWYAWQQSGGGFESSGVLTLDPAMLSSWTWTLLRTSFESFATYPLVAVAIVAMLAIGTALAIVDRGWMGTRKTLAVPLALLGGAVVLVTFIGSQRVELVELFPQIGTSSRYQSLAVAMLLPAIGVAAAELIRRQRVVAPIALGLLLVGVPANIAAFDGPGVRFYKASATNDREFLTLAADSPIAGKVSPDVHPNPNELGPANVTIGFLAFARRDGKLPDAPEDALYATELVNARLRLAQSLADDPVPDATCSDGSAPLEVVAQKGDRFVLGSPLRIAIGNPDGTFRAPMPFKAAFSGSTLTSQFDQTFQVSATKGSPTFTWCTVP